MLVAEEKNGYAWRTAATLAEPGVETDMWIGNACLTGSGRRLVIAYAPRAYTNRPALFDRGAFAAVVDLQTGAVTKLDTRVSIAYFNPGCGADETAVLTQAGDTDLGKTRLQRLDATTAKLGRAVELTGQITSAVPRGNAIVAADGFRLVSIDTAGKKTTLAGTTTVPFDVHPDRDGGVVFVDRAPQQGQAKTTGQSQAKSAEQGQVKYVRDGHVRTLASGGFQELEVSTGARGQVFIAGEAQPLGEPPASVSIVSAPAQSQISTLGHLAVSRTDDRKLDAKILQPLQQQAGERPAEVVSLAAESLSSKQKVTFTVDPTARVSDRFAEGAAPSPALGLPSSGRTSAAAASDSSETTDSGRACIVPRNDPYLQVYQPHWRQVEWAVDNAVRGDLTNVTRQNWRGSGLPAWKPQGLFPRIGLTGNAAGTVPAQIMLGILAQESNLWMASPHVIEGETGNPLTGNFYGHERDDLGNIKDWVIHWDKSDCGYGVAQITDGMNKNKPNPLPDNSAKAVAVDYATNVAAGLRILEDKWNQVQSSTDPMHINNNNPAKLENWYYAIWAYNTGFHPKSEASANNGAWGLGWINNPANPRFKPTRQMFLAYSPADATHPQDWPYQEKVIGWAGFSITKTYGGTTSDGFRIGSWNPTGTKSGQQNRIEAIPAFKLFCTAANECTWGSENSNNVPGEPKGPCNRADLKCWVHYSVAWKPDCNDSCGNEGIRFDPGVAEPVDAIPGGPTDPFKPNCSTAGLPAGARIVDDVPINVPALRPAQVAPCSKTWTNAGTFAFEFGDDSAHPGTYPSRADFHQLGSGFGAHQWFAYTRKPIDPKLKITGTWTFADPVNGWARLMVHVPLRRSHTQQASYVINTGGSTETRSINQFTEKNEWVNLGTFNFTGTPKVSLSTESYDGLGTAAISWDAMALQVLPKKPQHFVVGMGDSYSSGEGAGNYYHATDANYKNIQWNACRRSKDAWIRKTVLPGFAANETVGALADSFDPRLDFAFVACSGATSVDMQETISSHWSGPFDWSTYRDNADGRFRETAQLGAGFLDENTTLVALSIGGNDAGFPSVLTNCVTLNCYHDGPYNGTPGPGETALRNTITNVVTSTSSGVRGVLTDVGLGVKNYSRTKKARIVLMGYPALTDRAVTGCYWGAGTLSLDLSEAEMMGRLADHFAVTEDTMVKQLQAGGAPVSFADPRGEFEHHGACVDNGRPNGANDLWINGLIFDKTGPGDFQDVFDGCILDAGRCASRTSFHPNALGTSAYARVFQNHLSSIGYAGIP